MDIKNEYRYLVGGYYGVSLMDEYPLKEFVMQDIIEYIQNYRRNNSNVSFSYEEEWEDVKDNVSDKVKLQDALLVLNRINSSMDLIFLIKKKLREEYRK